MIRTPECSTPFGITEFRGLFLGGDHGLAGVVLNAFRHHGISRKRAVGMFFPRWVCSTPFGITEFRGHPGSVGGFLVQKCSTPFGITEFRGFLTLLSIQIDIV